jgi:hypothetical protein
LPASSSVFLLQFQLTIDPHPLTRRRKFGFFTLENGAASKTMAIGPAGIAGLNAGIIRISILRAHLSMIYTASVDALVVPWAGQWNANRTSTFSDQT